MTNRLLLLAALVMGGCSKHELDGVLVCTLDGVAYTGKSRNFGGFSFLERQPYADDTCQGALSIQPQGEGDE